MGPDEQAWGRRLRADPEDRESARRQLQARRRRGEPGEALAPLRDLADWDASPARQDLAIEEAARLLAGDFQHIATEVYEAGGARHRIATFYHLWTGIELQLIPGERGAGLAPFLIGRFPLRCIEARGHFWTAYRAERSACLPLMPNSLSDLGDGLASLGDGLRLPFEDEWRHAAAAGTATPYYWGAEPDFESLICAENSAGQRADPLERVARANAFGLVDPLGNVHELAQQRAFPVDVEELRWWNEDELGGAPGEGLLLCGGSARDPASRCRVDDRAVERRWRIDYGERLWGLRLARDIDRAPER